MRIEQYTPRWHDPVVSLANRVFGEGYFSRPSELAREAGSLILVAREGADELIGFVEGRVLPKAGLSDFFEGKISEIPDDIDKADAAGALGVIQAIAVSADHRRRSVGTKLLRAIHDALVGHGADKLIVTFKRGASAAQVGGIMAALEFEFWLKLPSYWEARCDSGEFKCLDRAERCACEAVFYRKAVY
jgi:GNAT superfamily N-acetyltransferase